MGRRGEERSEEKRRGVGRKEKERNDRTKTKKSELGS